MTKTLLETINLKKTFEHKNGIIKLFNNVNLKIRPGDLIALVGPSGSGKSSFLHLLALLDDATTGKILLNGVDTKKFNDEYKDEVRRHKISIIFQDNNLLSDFTALENVIMPLIIRGEEKSSSIIKATKVLKDVKILNRIHHFPSELSGGEQQRVAIARTLIAETDLILADEPTGNLDYKTSEDIFSYFKKLKKMNKAVIFATHNRELANKADYKLSIFKGNIKRVNAKT
ncbi:MAG: lipoprotein-releasing system ATP-binding protein [Pelagibacterales bacterium]|jgi:ABC-type lipoprotein export system ATPase subunit|nr:lipoprotein-releasing system ATP-binding protein [Pelagibacterales bacterium]